MIYLPYWQELVKLICGQVNQEACLYPCSTKVAGLRPRSTPDSFVVPQKSQQNRAPEFLAHLSLRLRCVPFSPFRFAAQKKTRAYALKHFSSKPCKTPFRFGCVIRGRERLKSSIWTPRSPKFISFATNYSVVTKSPVSSSKPHADRVPGSRSSGYTDRNR